MNATDGLSAGTVLAGRYRVESALGRGGMGAVYLVRHVRTEERLALKLIHASISGNPELVERFRREARAPAQIDSDHVVRVLDADVAPEIGGAPFLVMEFLKGRDLEHELKARGRLAPAEIVTYLDQAARALDKAHRLGIVHRDLKPENLFLAEREDGSVCLKVLDFGIARLAGDASHATATGSMLGTPLYMAPEQAQGVRGAVGPGTDVWALGLVAFRLLTGEIYWRFESGPDLILKIVAAPMVPPSALAPWLGPGFDSWFARCCARPMEQRYASAGEAVQALAAVFGVALPASSGAPFGVMGPPPGAAPLVAAPAFPTGAAAVTAAPKRAAIPIVLLAGAGLGTLAVLGVAVAWLVSSREEAPRAAARRPPEAAEPAQRPEPAPTTPAAPAPDACVTACAKLAECTHVTDPNCETGCRNSPTFATCVNERRKCSAISACGLAAYCGGKGPSGGKSCKATSDCEGVCVAAGGDNTACVCSCVRAMNPEHSNELMMNNQCALVHCPQFCAPPVNGRACSACFDANCRADSLPCRAH